MNLVNTPTCAATTKQGALCKNRALDDSSYCHVHQGSLVSRSLADHGANKGEYQSILDELQLLVQELRDTVNDLAESDLEPSDLFLAKLRQNLGQLPYDLQKVVIKAASRNKSDRLMYHDLGILLEVAQVRIGHNVRRLSEVGKQRAEKLPGGSVILDLLEGLKGTSLEDLFDQDTWEGLWLVLKSSAQTHLEHKPSGSADAVES